jgi:hypothetical protein
MFLNMDSLTGLSLEDNSDGLCFVGFVFFGTTKSLLEAFMLCA